jgi:hypothetical protein
MLSNAHNIKYIDCASHNVRAVNVALHNVILQRTMLHCNMLQRSTLLQRSIESLCSAATAVQHIAAHHAMRQCSIVAAQQPGVGGGPAEEP